MRADFVLAVLAAAWSVQSCSKAAENPCDPASAAFRENAAVGLAMGAAFCGAGHAVSASEATTAAAGTDATPSGTPGFTLSQTSGLSTSETGATATFTVRLNSMPTSTVTVSLTSSNAAEGSVNPAALSFTATSWETPQTVTITGVDDSVADGNAAYSIVTGAAASTDSRYNGLDPSDVSVTNLDAGEKRTFVTAATFTGAAVGGVAAADTLCNSDANKPTILPNSYKALIVDTLATRRGSLSPNVGDSQVDWVLQLSTQYFRSDGSSSVATSTAAGIFTFPITASFAGAAGSYWTGLKNDWTTNLNCTNWTTTAGNGDRGDGNAVNNTSVSIMAPGPGIVCTSPLKLLCIQQ